MGRYESTSEGEKRHNSTILLIDTTIILKEIKK